MKHTNHCLSFTLTVRSSVPRAIWAWIEGYSMASPYNSMVARMAFCNNGSTKEFSQMFLPARKATYEHVKLYHVSQLHPTLKSSNTM